MTEQEFVKRISEMDDVDFVILWRNSKLNWRKRRTLTDDKIKMLEFALPLLDAELARRNIEII